VASVAVLGAAGYAGAVAAALLHRHPYFELAHVTARSDAGAMLEAIHPRTRVPLLLEDYDPAVQGDADAALICWPHGVAAPAVAALRERGVRVVDLSADFRLRDRAVYDHWYGRHGAPELFGEAVYGPARAVSRGDRRARTSWPTPAAIRPRRCSGSHRWRARASSRTW
jgi:N-acetyl-gamma-glutamyl-phosphate reductase